MQLESMAGIAKKVMLIDIALVGLKCGYMLDTSHLSLKQEAHLL